jgi:hypothetical protein
MIVLIDLHLQFLFLVDKPIGPNKYKLLEIILGKNLSKPPAHINLPAINPLGRINSQ